MRSDVRSIVIVLVLALFSFSAARPAYRRPQRRISPEESALEARGIEAAAQVSGHFLQVVGPYEGFVSIVTLPGMDVTDAIVADVVDQQPHVGPTNRAINTRYDIKIAHTIVGDLRSGQTVVLEVFGGRIVFPDGSIAETVIDMGRNSSRGYMPLATPSIGKRYLLLLDSNNPAPTVTGYRGLQRGPVAPWEGPPSPIQPMSSESYIFEVLADG